MNFSEFEASCQDPAPAYFLRTGQEFLKRKVLELARSQIPEPGLSFDWRVFDLEKESETDLVQQSRTLPWLSPRRWIYVSHAERGGKELLQYLSSPSEKTVLILEISRKPAKWPSLPTIEFKDDLDIRRWLSRRAAEEGFQLGGGVAQTLLELVGDDLQLLDNEFEKLVLLNFDSKKITRESVLKSARQSREYDIFALISSLALGRSREALSILERLYEAGMLPTQIIAMLYWNFRRLLVAREWLRQGKPFEPMVKKLKIWSYKNRRQQLQKIPESRLRELLLKLRQADRLCKTTNLEDRHLLERLIIDTSAL